MTSSESYGLYSYGHALTSSESYGLYSYGLYSYGHALTSSESFFSASDFAAAGSEIREVLSASMCASWFFNISTSILYLCSNN